MEFLVEGSVFLVQNGGYLKVGKNTIDFTFMYFFVLRVIYSEVSSS